jgi:hypothetical protein
LILQKIRRRQKGVVGLVMMALRKRKRVPEQTDYFYL